MPPPSSNNPVTPQAAGDVVIVDSASKSFKQGSRTVVAIQSISLRIPRGRFIAIMGASGSGKSTLLHLIAGLTPPTTGSVIVAGQNLANFSDHQLTLFRRTSVGIVFQAFNLIPTLSALENVLLPAMLAGTLTPQARDHAKKLLDKLGMLPRLSHRPDSLSGGEQQRIAIARALMTDPAVLLADEPTGNLDSITAAGVCTLLQNLARDDHRTIIMVTHEPSVAIYADEVILIRDGLSADRFLTSDTPTEEALALRYQQSMKAQSQTHLSKSLPVSPPLGKVS